MKELVILSGKGGTGKTSLTAAFASLSENKVLCDADVDAADLHLLTNPDILVRTDFKGGGVAVINKDKCTQCGTCIELCRFDAVDDDFNVNEIECEGCGVCVDLCPEQAIDFPIKTCGQWFISNTRFGPMVHARLGIAEENSGKLVSLVRQEAKKLAETKGFDLIITDGPPGIGCPVIASLGGANALVIVAEPTVSGLHDMERVAQLAQHFKVPCMVCINKADLNPEKADAIEKIAREKGVKILGRIPFDPDFTKAMIQTENIVEFNKDSNTSRVIKEIWDKIMMSSAINN
ncbi:CobQ/CobB/MinD/ParA nucleotide binding domain-containing protein [Desulfonema limicola]|uniref:CobQ/CobB/MinD/ParA nucleotide binding domain-containing protein n=1 Tax=Desulfonema limicola TaxID=45656 RepID=A0A975GIX3_9BACT|nr:ATP-binding protein [Desulfonema limicola]QTA82916.1 CobQ/CobB/MinD/ParA nucleotide binding domain-containing protein [Desulfonema limicola]